MINHAPGINERIYIREPYTKLCLGIDHAIIRAPFLQIPPSSKRSIGHVFISLGGSDYFKITERIVTLLNDHDLFTGLHIMCSSSFPEDMMASLEDLSNSSSGKVNLYKNLSSEQIVALMDSCQYAIVSASTVLLEAYSRGLICFAGYYTNNQILIYDGFIKEKKAIGLGDLRKADISVIDDAYKNAGQLQLIPVRSYKNLKQIFLSLADA